MLDTYHFILFHTAIGNYIIIITFHLLGLILTDHFDCNNLIVNAIKTDKIAGDGTHVKVFTRSCSKSKFM